MSAKSRGSDQRKPEARHWAVLTWGMGASLTRGAVSLANTGSEERRAEG